MKKFLSLGALLLVSLGVGCINANADEISSVDYSQISTETADLENGFEITNIIVPNEYAEQWELENNWTDPENIGTKDTMNEVSDLARGATIPWSHWNVVSKGTAYFDGSFTSYKTLYSNYNYTGTTSYAFKLKNTGSSNLKYQFKDLAFTYYSGTSYTGTTIYSTITVKSKDYAFYLRVVGANGDYSGGVSGYVSKK